MLAPEIGDGREAHRPQHRARPSREAEEPNPEKHLQQAIVERRARHKRGIKLDADGHEGQENGSAADPEARTEERSRKEGLPTRLPHLRPPGQ